MSPGGLPFLVGDVRPSMLRGTPRGVPPVWAGRRTLDPWGTTGAWSRRATRATATTRRARGRRRPCRTTRRGSAWTATCRGAWLHFAASLDGRRLSHRLIAWVLLRLFGLGVLLQLRDLLPSADRLSSRVPGRAPTRREARPRRAVRAVVQNRARGHRGTTGRQARPPHRGDGLRRRGAAPADAGRRARAAADAAGAAQGVDQRRRPGSPRCCSKPIFAAVVEAAGGVEALMDARVTALEGDLADVPPLPDRPRRARPLRGRRVLRPAGRRGLPHQRRRHPRPARPDGRGGRHDRHGPLRAHLDGVRRRAPPRRGRRGSGRARRRPRGRADLGPGAAPVGRAPLPHGVGAGEGAPQGREGAQPRGHADRRPGDRGGPPRVGQGRAGPAGHRARPLAGLDRLLHLHQGARRARRRGARQDPARLDRAAEHHRVRAGPPAPGLDRGLQDGRAADPGLRPRRAAGVPRRRRHHRRHRAGRPRGRRDRRRARAPAGDRRRRRTSTCRRASATRSPSGTSTTTCAPTSTSTRSSPASAAPCGCPTGGSPERRPSSGCSPPASAPTRSPTTPSATPRAATAPATSPASSTSRAAGWSSCGATSTSTGSTRRQS